MGSTSDVCFNHWDHGGRLKCCFNHSSQSSIGRRVPYMVQKSSLNKRRHVGARYERISTKFRHRTVHYGTDAKHLPSLWTCQHPAGPSRPPSHHTHTHTHTHTVTTLIMTPPPLFQPAPHMTTDSNSRRYVWQQRFSSGCRQQNHLHCRQKNHLHCQCKFFRKKTL